MARITEKSCDYLMKIIERYYNLEVKWRRKYLLKIG